MITVMFDTDDFRGDHASDRRVLEHFDESTPLSGVVARAEALKTYRGDRATVVILPVHGSPVARQSTAPDATAHTDRIDEVAEAVGWLEIAVQQGGDLGGKRHEVAMALSYLRDHQEGKKAGGAA